MKKLMVIEFTWWYFKASVVNPPCAIIETSVSQYSKFYCCKGRTQRYDMAMKRGKETLLRPTCEHCSGRADHGSSVRSFLKLFIHFSIQDVKSDVTQ